MSGTIVRRFSRLFQIVLRQYAAGVSGSVSRGNVRSDDYDEEKVAEEALKRRIQKFYDGDGKVLPLIFEGIWKRELAGKNDEGLIDHLPIGRRNDFTGSSEESE